MKQGKRLTRDQKEVVASHGLNPKEYSYIGETEFYLKLVNKTTGVPKMIDKFKRRNKR